MNAIEEEDRLDVDAAKQVMRRAARMAAPFKRTVLSAIGCTAMTTLGLLMGPVIVRYGIDDGIKPADSATLRTAVIAYIIVVSIAYVSSRQQYIFINRAGEGFLRLLRIRVFGHIQKQSLAFFDRNKSGVLVARMTADIESMAELVQWGLLQFVSAALLLTFSFILLLILSWQLTIVALLVMPVIVIASRKFQRDSNAAYLDVRDNVGSNLSTLQEGITGVRVIQAYAREPEQTRRFEESNRGLFRSHLHSLRVSTWFFGLVEASGVIASALAIGVGGWLVNRGDVTVGTAVAVLLLLAQLFEPVQQLSQLYNTVQSSTAALDKLFGILDTTPDVLDGELALPASGALAVSAVGFRYPETESLVLDDVSITVANGERLAVVGATGSGKSTLAKLMARLYDPTAGTITFGGVDLRDATMGSLRQRVVVVPQEGFLFGGTIADNVRVARADASDDDVRAALDAIGALDRFEQFEEGIHTEVRERGSRLSAGERQLVSLARAALVDPAVLVLDEATSNLDPGTEVIVEHALESLMGSRTTIVVAHRLSTIRRADRIAVIDAGKLAELGTHDELLALGGHYARLAHAWAASQPN
ncbi:ABC transporter ATP-binding protein [uncultured Ilumatobacter sp.]|uniref:ABC transporter ATP-binding protein n=1 Tax=uncultured Ilumatobacter sp. TaxID=879968 RepID=UPI00374E4E69